MLFCASHRCLQGSQHLPRLSWKSGYGQNAINTALHVLAKKQTQRFSHCTFCKVSWLFWFPLRLLSTQHISLSLVYSHQHRIPTKAEKRNNKGKVKEILFTRRRQPDNFEQAWGYDLSAVFNHLLSRDPVANKLCGLHSHKTLKKFAVNFIPDEKNYITIQCKFNLEIRINFAAHNLSRNKFTTILPPSRACATNFHVAESIKHNAHNEQKFRFSQWELISERERFWTP